MKCLVTGGAGFIGSHLVEFLLSRGHEVTVLDNFFSGKRGFLSPKAELIEADIRDEKAVAKALEGASWVFHQAALRSVPKSVEKPAEYISVNVEGTLKLLLKCCKKNIRFIFASSSSVYGENPVFPQKEDQLPMPISPYAASKRAGELLLRVFSACYGLECCSLRYFNVYGPRQDPYSEYAAVVPRFILKALKSQPLEIHGDGEQSRDFTFVEDCVRANFLGAQKPFHGDLFNIAGGQSISVNRIASLVEELCGKKLERVHTPPRPGDVRKTWADMTTSREKLGFEPSVPFKEGLKKTFDYFRTWLNDQAESS